MPAWSARERQRIVDAYLNDSGCNQFVPREFLDTDMSDGDIPFAEQMARRLIGWLR